MTDASPPGSPPTGVPTCYRHPGRETYIACQRCGRPICPDCMRDAAVGFQCPQCVSEGARATRSGRTRFGGVRRQNPGLVTYVLLALNALVWLAILATGGRGSRLVETLALIPRGRCEDGAGAYYPTVTDEATCATGGPAVSWVPGVEDGAVWQLLTNAFTHVELFHIAGNMLLLYFIGPPLEAMFGRMRFLALYLGAALTASAVIMWLGPESGTTLGASGAVFGLIGAELVIAHKSRQNLQMLLVWLGIATVMSLTLPNVSWQGHLGGFLGGAAIGAALAYAPRGRRTLVQALGVAAVVLVSSVAIVVRALALG